MVSGADGPSSSHQQVSQMGGRRSEGGVDRYILHAGITPYPRFPPHTVIPGS